MAKKILVSQPKPQTEKSPYFEVAQKYKIELVFRPFIKIEPMSAKDFRQQKALTVKLNGRAINQLNELEWIDGKVWANVYMSDMIVIINPETGNIEATVDCTGLLPRHLRDQYTDVLNGIAYNPATKKVYLTGKYWKRLYEVELVEKK